MDKIKRKKEFVLDKKFLVEISVMFFCIVVFITQHEMLETKKIIILTFCMIVGAIFVFMEPNYYVLDSDGIAIYYFVFIKDYHRWNEIKSIRVHTKNRGYKKDFYKYYLLRTSAQNKKPSYMKNEITKSKAIKKFINKYWNGRIKGEEDIDS